jgi:hypothetical protein
MNRLLITVMALALGSLAQAAEPTKMQSAASSVSSAASSAATKTGHAAKKTGAAIKKGAVDTKDAVKSGAHKAKAKMTPASAPV